MVDKATVEKVAKIARLTLTSQEISQFEKELNEILDAFKILEKADLEKAKPSLHSLELKNVTRKDEVKPSLPREKALANTRQKQEGYFLGPPVV